MEADHPAKTIRPADFGEAEPLRHVPAGRLGEKP